MGIIERKLRAGVNQEFAATRQLTTKLSPADAFEKTVAICQKMNAEHRASNELHASSIKEIFRASLQPADPLRGGCLNIRHSPDKTRVFIAFPSERCFDADQAKRRSGLLGQVTFSPSDSGTLVQLRLLRWSVDRSSGKMKYKAAWQAFADRLADVLKV